MELPLKAYAFASFTRRLLNFLDIICVFPANCLIFAGVVFNWVAAGVACSSDSQQ
jgi:hypothetical protein